MRTSDLQLVSSFLEARRQEPNATQTRRIAGSTFAPSPWLKVLDHQPSLMPKMRNNVRGPSIPTAVFRFRRPSVGATGAPSRSAAGINVGEGTSPSLFAGLKAALPHVLSSSDIRTRAQHTVPLTGKVLKETMHDWKSQMKERRLKVNTKKDSYLRFQLSARL